MVLKSVDCCGCRVGCCHPEENIVVKKTAKSVKEIKLKLYRLFQGVTLENLIPDTDTAEEGQQRELLSDAIIRQYGSKLLDCRAQGGRFIHDNSRLTRKLTNL